MCIIIDANVFHEGFSGRADAGKKVFEWIAAKKTVMVIGGKLLKEIAGNSPKAARWIQQGKLAKTVIAVNDSEVDDAEKRLDREGVCKSDDPHVIALAQVSGARLLYSNDRPLHQDFTNRELLNSPRGKVYSTREYSSFRPHHRDMLNKNHCARQ